MRWGVEETRRRICNERLRETSDKGANSVDGKQEAAVLAKRSLLKMTNLKPMRITADTEDPTKGNIVKTRQRQPKKKNRRFIEARVNGTGRWS